MCARWENFVVHLRTFDAFSNKWNSALCLFMPFVPLTRPAHFSKCSNACRPVQWDVHLPRIRWYTCAHVWKLGEFRGTSAHFRRIFQTSEAVHYAFLCLLCLSHDLQYTCGNVLMHADLFSGMYTCHWNRWYPCAHVWKLGEFRGTSAHFQTHFQNKWSSDIMPLLCSFAPLTRPEHTFLNVLMHADLFSGM